jgi:hypothetical protein
MFKLIMYRVIEYGVLKKKFNKIKTQIFVENFGCIPCIVEKP